jgi:drug/metabolite transporter (DMT)-like permease
MAGDPAPRGATTGAGIAMAILAMTMFSSLDVVSKILGQEMSVFQIIWVRFVLFVPFALALAWRPGQGIAWRSGMPWLQTLRVVILLVEMWFFLSAFAAIPLADAHAIGASAPLLVTALSVPLLGEKVGWRRWAAVGVGFAGMLLIVRPGFAEFSWMMLYAVAGAVLWAVYQIVLKIVGRTDSAATTGVWTAVVGAILTSLVGPFFWTAPDTQGWVLLLVAALIGGVAHTVYSRAFNLAPASVLQPFAYLLLVYAALFGWLVFGDIPDRWTIAGATLIVASGLYSFHRERVRAAPRQAP